MAGFDHTREVLKKFAEALKCKICGNVSQDPHTVVGCGHFSCYNCLMSLKLSQCPECGHCFYPSDLEPDNIVRTVLSEWKAISSLIGVSTQSELKDDLKSVDENPKSKAKQTKSNDVVNKENKVTKESPINNLNLSMSSESEFEGFDNIGEAFINYKGKNSNSYPIKKPTTKLSTNFLTDLNSEGKISLISDDKTSKQSDKIKKRIHNDDNNNSNKRRLSVRCDNEEKSSKNETISSSCDIISATPQEIKSDTPKKKRRSYSLDEKNLKSHSRGDKIKDSHKGKKERRHTDDYKKVTSYLSDDVKDKLVSDIKECDLQNDGLPKDKRDECTVNTKNKFPYHDKNNDVQLNKDKKDKPIPHNDSKDVLNSNDVTKNKKDKLHLDDDKLGLKNNSHADSKKSKYYNLNEKSKSDFYDEKENKSDSNVIKNDKTQKSSNDDGGKRSRSSSSTKDVSISNSVRDKKDLMKRNSKGETKLHVACMKGKLDLVKSLLDEGATPNTKDNAGWTPLHEAVERNDIAMVEMLLDAGAYVNVPGLFNITPILEAVLKDNVPIARLLLQRGADISLRSNFNYVPMHSAQSDEMEKLLSVYGKQNNTWTKKDDFIAPMPEPTLLLFDGSIDDKKMELCMKFCDKFGVGYRNSFSKEISHLVVDDDGKLVCSPELNVLRAIVNGIPIISFAWIKECLEKCDLQKLDKWEIIGTEEYPRSKASMKSRQCAAKLLPKLFDGLHVCLSNYWPKSEKFTKSIATDLLRDAGAIILTREPDVEAIPPDEQKVMFHADVSGPMSVCSHVILYVNGPNEPKLRYNMEHIKTLSTKWLFHCIQTFSIVDPPK